MVVEPPAAEATPVETAAADAAPVDATSPEVLSPVVASAEAEGVAQAVADVAGEVPQVSDEVAASSVTLLPEVAVDRQAAALAAYQHGEHLLFLPREAGDIRILQEITTVHMMLTVRDGEAELVHTCGPREHSTFISLHTRSTLPEANCGQRDS